MKMVKFFAVVLFVNSGCVFAAEPITNNGAAQPQVKVQRAPVIGSMLPDGREVPARFQGVESKEQKARREREEQEQRGSEKE